MVFAPRVVEAIERGVEAPSPTGAMRAVLTCDDPDCIPGAVVTPPGEPASVDDDPAAVRAALQATMTRCAGVVRTAGSLDEARTSLRQPEARDPGGIEARNLATVAAALVASATQRAESRGNHWRADHPDPDPALRVRLVHKAT